MSKCRNSASRIPFITLVIAWATTAASAGPQPFSGMDPDGGFRLDPNEFSPYRLDRPDSFAAEKYRKEGAEVVLWTKEAALPSPDNAALLYYQAFLLRPQPDDATFLQINAVLRGAEPDGRVRAYLGNCRPMIHTTEVAALVPQCTWGIRHLDPNGLREMSLLEQIRQLIYVLALDARTLGTDGCYDAAFARCLTMRRLARHVGDETMLAQLFSRAIDSLSQGTMQYVLGLTPADADIFQRLRGQLAAVSGASGSIAKGMQGDLDLLLEGMRNDAGLLERIRQELVKNATDQQAKEQASDLTDEDVLALAREPYQRFLYDIFQIMDSEMPYEQKHTEIDRRQSRLIEDYGDNPAVSYAMGSSYVGTPWITRQYTLSLHHAARCNALKVAVEVYLVRAQTGQLPQTLPAYSLKDPFSGQDFEYEVTASGFILRCRAQDLDVHRIVQYEFKVRDGGTQNP
jgi:hypothetical protein